MNKKCANLFIFGFKPCCAGTLITRCFNADNQESCPLYLPKDKSWLTKLLEWGVKK